MKTLLSTYKRYVQQSTTHRSELVSIQWLRGIAVMMVFVYHAEDILNLVPGFENYHSFWKHYGYSAPDLFFVISGFIMCFVTFELKFRPMGWLIRRILRIYPIYLCFALFSISIWLYNPEMTMGSGHQDWGTILKFLFIFPQENLPLLFVAWTLEHEIVFYTLVFIVAALMGKSLAVVIVTGIISVAAILKAGLQDIYPVLDFWDYHIFSLYMVQFFMGALVFELRNHLQKLPAKPVLLAGLAVFGIAGLVCVPAPLNEEHISKVVMFGLAHSLFLVGAINWELEKRKKINDFLDFKRRPFLVQMGDASYSIYLSHVFCLAICGKIILAMQLSGSMAVVAIVIGASISLFLGWTTYHLLEKPMMHASKDMLSMKKRREAKKAATNAVQT